MRVERLGWSPLALSLALAPTVGCQLLTGLSDLDESVASSAPGAGGTTAASSGQAAGPAGGGDAGAGGTGGSGGDAPSAPELLAVGPGPAGALTWSPTHVYWLVPDAGQVLRVPLDGGEPYQIVADGLGQLHDIFSTGDRLWFTQDDPPVVYWMDLMLPDPVATEYAVDEPGPPVAISAADDGVYWSLAGTERRIRRGHPYGGVPVETVSQGGPYVAQVVAINTGRFAMLDQDAVHFVQTSTGYLDSLPAAGATSVACDGHGVFWATAREIWRAELYLEAPMPIASAAATAIAAEEGLTSRLYWTEGSCGADPPSSTLRSTSKLGKDPVLVATGLTCPVDLEVRASYVYWSDRITGEIWRVAGAGPPER